jgi:CheY-like chemotaxis protein
VAKSILLVDDDADVRALLGEFLIEHGFVVHAARDGRHALQVLSHIDAPDVILLDYQMPVMNGSQFLARKRWNPRLRCVPVVILSAWTRQWSGAGLDAVEVLSKPIDLDRLLALIGHICDGTHSIHIHARGAIRASRRETAGAHALWGGHS